MTAMKLCKDCFWAAFEEPPYWREFTGPKLVETRLWLCHHPTAASPPEPDYVTGGRPSPLRHMLCESMRSRPEWCGPDGRFWEPVQV